MSDSNKFLRIKLNETMGFDTADHILISNWEEDRINNHLQWVDYLINHASKIYILGYEPDWDTNPKLWNLNLQDLTLDDIEVKERDKPSWYIKHGSLSYLLNKDDYGFYFKKEYMTHDIIMPFILERKSVLIKSKKLKVNYVGYKDVGSIVIAVDDYISAMDFLSEKTDQVATIKGKALLKQKKQIKKIAKVNDAALFWIFENHIELYGKNIKLCIDRLLTNDVLKRIYNISD